jgi:hypothetical protein
MSAALPQSSDTPQDSQRLVPQQLFARQLCTVFGDPGDPDPSTASAPFSMCKGDAYRDPDGGRSTHNRVFYLSICFAVKTRRFYRQARRRSHGSFTGSGWRSCLAAIRLM